MEQDKTRGGVTPPGGLLSAQFRGPGHLIAAPGTEGGSSGQIRFRGIGADGDRKAAGSLHVDGTVCSLDGDGSAAGILNGACIIQIRERTVTGHNPGGAAPDGKAAIPVSAITRAGLVINDSALQRAAADHVEVQLADGIPDDIAFHILINCGEAAVSPVRALTPPAARIGVAGALQEEIIFVRVRYIDVVQDEGGLGVRRVEHAAVFRRQRAALHLERAVADLGVAGHALVQDNVPGAVVLLVVRHIARQVTVKRRMELRPSMQTASDPLAVRSASWIEISAVE